MSKPSETQSVSARTAAVPPPAHLLHDIVANILRPYNDDRFRVVITRSDSDPGFVSISVYANNGGDHFAAAVRRMEVLQRYGLKIARMPGRLTDFVTYFGVGLEKKESKVSAWNLES